MAGAVPYVMAGEGRPSMTSLVTPEQSWMAGLRRP